MNKKLIKEARELLESVNITDSSGDSLYFNENWLALNEAADNPLYTQFQIESNKDWVAILQSIRNRFPERDLVELKQLCIEGEWPQED